MKQIEKLRTKSCHWLAVLLLLAFAACGDQHRVVDGGDYTGDLQQHIPNGYGDLDAHGFYYMGSWKDGKYHGFGKLVRGDSVYTGEFSEGKRQGQGSLTYRRQQQTYSGEWKADQRNGLGILTDSLGRSWKGNWQNDSLKYGTFIDSTGIYLGQLNDSLQPSGFGKWTSRDGLSHYEGEWNQGKHNHFGFFSQVGHNVQCGWWKNGHFLGEKMKYTSSRVYGIDISRFQHKPERWVVIRKGRKRKRYKVGAPINWQQLRITHLGANHNANAVGSIDYPISFCYIKSTQGKTIKSDYYAGDAHGARSVGIKVGAYHFMSPLAGSIQARWFLKNTAIAANDLPPMLDVELTSKQIHKLGGINALFHEMLSWLHIVERETGKKPILYVGQNFINKYLPQAPKELQDYNIWIARYGQYRPYVKLLYWQLSPFGRVRGINGSVDIDVFNGSMEQFKRYVNSDYKELP